MDRLKGFKKLNSDNNGKDLHSNMDRLKVHNMNVHAIEKEIYIPIWID